MIIETKMDKENIKWSIEQSYPTEFQRSISQASKPLISILDLGKLLLQYSRDGDATKVHELIVKGAPFNADWLGMTPLHYAAKRDNYEICDMLLRGGINKDAKTKVDRTALHFAVYEGHREIVELLLSRSVDVDIKDMLRMTALHWAIEKRHVAIARLLIKHGADVSGLSKFDKSPIMIAVQTGQTELVEELETVQQNQRDKMLLNIQHNQSETNEAVNSITLNGLSTPKFDLSSLAEESLANDESLRYEKTGQENKSANHPQNNVNYTHHEGDKLNFGKSNQNGINTSGKVEEQALEMLKHHGITMLPTDDPQNLLTTALEGGRKLVLSEAGKLVLKGAAQNNAINSKLPNDGNMWRKFSYSKFVNSAKVHNKKAPLASKAKAVTPVKNKNVKIISYDMFKRMYGTDLGNSFKRTIRPNESGSSPPKVTKLIKLNNISNRKPIIHKIDVLPVRAEQIEQTVHNDKEIYSEDNDDLPPNIIEVCSESESEENLNEQQNLDRISHAQNYSPPKAVSANSSQDPQNDTPSLSVPEIFRQLSSLQQQIDVLRQQLEQTKKQNEEYRIRLEDVERSTGNF